MTEISVVIPNFNGMRFLPTCLDSLRRQTFAGAEIILVDNGSTDDSVSYVAEHYPEVIVVRLERNFGFCRAVNEGIRRGRGRYVALLNNDTEVDRLWLAELYQALQTNPQVGFCACRMINYFRRGVLDGAGDCFPRSARPFKRGHGEEVGKKYTAPELVFGASGGAAIYRKELFASVGYFDEDFFSYLEDVDLSFRAQLGGFKCLYVPTAVVYHMEGGTIVGDIDRLQTAARRDTDEKTYLLARNKIYVIVKNLPFHLLVKHFPYILWGSITSLAYHLFKSGYALDFLSGTLRGFLDARRFSVKRRAIQKTRQLGTKEIEQLIRECGT
jgi:GT2 family glycosyltransferase